MAVLCEDINAHGHEKVPSAMKELKHNSMCHGNYAKVTISALNMQDKRQTIGINKMEYI